MHEARIAEDKGPLSGPVWAYRGASIASNPQATQFRLDLAGHPFDGRQGFGHREHLMQLVDAWLDVGRLPPPYVWPPR